MAEICQPQIAEINSSDKSIKRNLLGKYDLLGKKNISNDLNNQVLIYFYDDGTYEKRCQFFENQFK